MASRWSSRDAVVTFTSGSGQQVTWGPGPGDLTIGPVNAENFEHLEVRDRGQHDGFVPGDDLVQECQITLGLVNQSLTEAAQTRVWDSVMKSGIFASDTSLDADVWAFQIDWAASRAANSASIQLPKCEGQGAFSENREGATFVISFKNYGAPVVT